MNSVIKRQLLNTDNFIFWVGLAFLLRLPIYAFLYFSLDISIYLASRGVFAIEGGDTFSYFTPIENLLTKNIYANDIDNIQTYAGRMPGYGTLYYLFRLLFEQKGSINLIITFQILFSIISVFFLSKIAEHITNNKFVFYCTFLLAAVSTYSSIFDFYLLTESFTTSLLIMSVYFLFKYISSGKLMQLWVVGLLICWALFLKPYFLPVLVLFSLYLLVELIIVKKWPLLKASIHCSIIWIPFIVIDTIWVIRNYQYFHKVVPLQINMQAGYTYTQADIQLRQFVTAWGGDIISWNPKAEIRWFDAFAGRINQRDKGITSFDDTVVLPDYIYTKDFNIDSLRKLRQGIVIANDLAYQLNDKDKISLDVEHTLSIYTHSFQSQKPVTYHILVPLILLKKYLLHSGTYNLINKSYNQLNLFMKSIKIIYSLFYLVIVILGTYGVFTGLFSKNTKCLLVICISGYFTLLFPFVLRSIEYRYWVSAYPLYLILATIAFSSLLDKSGLVIRGWRNLKIEKGSTNILIVLAKKHTA
jgi:hypothetical protein